MLFAFYLCALLFSFIYSFYLSRSLPLYIPRLFFFFLCLPLSTSLCPPLSVYSLSFFLFLSFSFSFSFSRSLFLSLSLSVALSFRSFALSHSSWLVAQDCMVS